MCWVAFWLRVRTSKQKQEEHKQPYLATVRSSRRCSASSRGLHASFGTLLGALLALLLVTRTLLISGAFVSVSMLCGYALWLASYHLAWVTFERVAEWRGQSASTLLAAFVMRSPVFTSYGSLMPLGPVGDDALAALSTGLAGAAAFPQSLHLFVNYCT